MIPRKTFSIITISSLIFVACSQPVAEEQDEENRQVSEARTTLMQDDNPACHPQYNAISDQEIQELLDYSLNTQSMKKLPNEGDTVAHMKTNKGDIKILLYTDHVPETTNNFIELANAGKYDDTIFHRVIDCFMIQGGDFENSNGTGGHSHKGPGTKFEDEFVDELKHIKGALSMANAGPNTNGSQFFIVQADRGTPHLDGMHSVFGFVYEGLDVVDEIGGVQTGANNRPVEDIVVESVQIIEFSQE